MFLHGQTAFRATPRWPRSTRGLLALWPPAGSTQGAVGRSPGLGTHWMETVETAEGILPMPPLSTSSMACFISILW